MLNILLIVIIAPVYNCCTSYNININTILVVVVVVSNIEFSEVGIVFFVLERGFAQCAGRVIAYLLEIFGVRRQTEQKYAVQY